ncbi:hypothetical protein vseg_020837 [Gypsophila vaccaria]
MRDMVRCLSEHAVKVSETGCVNNGAAANAVRPNPAVQNAVVSVYRARVVSSQKPLLITVTWCRNPQLGQAGGGLIIDFDHCNQMFRLNNTQSRLFRKKKGQKSFQMSNSSSKIDLFWDLSLASYDQHSGHPEPVDGYYILVSIDANLALSLGDLAEDAASKRQLLNSQVPTPSALVSRTEHYSGNTLLCATRAQFCQSAVAHDIVISCSSRHSHSHSHSHSQQTQQQQQQQQPVMQVCIDKKTVIKVRRLQWNFRGNQTVFVDGLLIDMMWDVHDWYFNPVSGIAVFMFKIRSGGESSRLWLLDDHHFLHKNHTHDHSLDFSLLLYATKIP